MRKPIIAGNWKMNKTNSEAIALANDLKRHLNDCVGVDVVICPPFTALSEVAAVVDGSKIDLGAQNIYFVKEGAYTGEISPLMLKDTGCQFIIIGHSERRALFGETNEGVNQK
ncbi:MAG: triosephosphate isomerase, partial [Candidatus Omnitrophica bacterium]|nr:triosephosphate isomerase [Candidatus Omnitrophota bacterium]